MGLDGSEIKSCCNQRFYLEITREPKHDIFEETERKNSDRYIQCNDFVSSKPWKAGVER